MIGKEIPTQLLSLVISMAAVPTIRCSPNGAAGMVASSLSALIRDHLVCGRNNTYIGRILIKMIDFKAFLFIVDHLFDE